MTPAALMTLTSKSARGRGRGERTTTKKILQLWEGKERKAGKAAGFGGEREGENAVQKSAAAVSIAARPRHRRRSRRRDGRGLGTGELGAPPSPAPGQSASASEDVRMKIRLRHDTRSARNQVSVPSPRRTVLRSSRLLDTALDERQFPCSHAAKGLQCRMRQAARGGGVL